MWSDRKIPGHPRLFASVAAHPDRPAADLREPRRKIPTTRARRLISLLTLSTGLVDQIFDQWLRGKVVKASTSAFASSISGPMRGKAAASWSRTLSQVAATVAGSG